MNSCRMGAEAMSETSNVAIIGVGGSMVNCVEVNIAGGLLGKSFSAKGQSIEVI